MLESLDYDNNLITYYLILIIRITVWFQGAQTVH
jgi:hypothetical protein